MMNAPKEGRLEWWDEFSAEVRKHIEEYCIPQYGDYPNDLMTETDPNVMWNNINRYMLRNTRTNARPEGQLMDLLKVAHYANLIWCKYSGRDKGIREDGNENSNSDLR